MKKYGILILILALACFAGCGGKSDSGDAAAKDDHGHGEAADHSEDHGAGAGDAMAAAEMAAKGGSSLSGKATFVPEGDQVMFTLFVEGVPSGSHPVRIHQTGDCSADDASSAGAVHENGELGNVAVGENGQGTLSLTAESIGTGGDNDIVGKAVAVHGPDGVVGCGVVQKEM